MQSLSFEFAREDAPFVIIGATAGSEEIHVALDTGNAAPFALLVSPALASKAAARSEDGAEAQPSSVAVGETDISYTPAILPNLSLGSFRMAEVTVGISPAVETVSKMMGRKIDAILGYEFLKSHSISVDYPNRLIDFDALPGLADKGMEFRTAPRLPLTLVEVSLNDSGPYTMALDTGAMSSIITTAVATAAGIHAGSAVGVAGAGGMSSVPAHLATANIAIGHTLAADQRLVIADILAPIEAAVGAHLDGVLGADFLARGKLTIDYRSQRLWLEILSVQ